MNSTNTNRTAPQKPTMVPVVCAWCKTITGEVEAADGIVGGVSHGICKACEDKFFPEEKE